jgi:hypothetical protein
MTGVGGAWSAARVAAAATNGVIGKDLIVPRGLGAAKMTGQACRSSRSMPSWDGYPDY